jgi:hypothetical protein
LAALELVGGTVMSDLGLAVASESATINSGARHTGLSAARDPTNPAMGAGRPLFGMERRVRSIAHLHHCGANRRSSTSPALNRQLPVAARD